MPKVFKDSPFAEAGLAVGTNNARLHGRNDNYVAVDEQGVTINGPMSIVSGLAQVRTGALWTFNGEMALSIPSTLATPTPVVIINPPVKQLKNIMETVQLMVTLLGG